jgi:hypothetical protein
MPEINGLVQHLGSEGSTTNITIVSQTSAVYIFLEVRSSDPAPVLEYKKSIVNLLAMAQAASKTVIAGYSESGELIYAIVEEEISLAPLTDLIHKFITQTGVAIQDFRVTLKGKIVDAEVLSAIDNVIDNAHFISIPPAPFQVVRLEQKYFPTPADFAAARAAYRDNLLTRIAIGDLLVIVDWYPLRGDRFNTIALISTLGDCKYEPILDTVFLRRESIGPMVVPGRPNQIVELLVIEKSDTWVNIIGIEGARITLRESMLGSNGCSATFTAEGISSSAFPIVIEQQQPMPPAIDPARANQLCEGGMQCGRASLPYVFVLRIGIKPLSVDLVRLGRAIRTEICADGSFSEIV